MRCAVSLCAVCGVRHCNSCSLQWAAMLAAVCGSACGRVRLSGNAHGSVRQYAAVCGNVRLSDSAAMHSRAAVCVFSNEFKIYSYKSV